MSKWRRTIWREEEAEKEFGACQEENSFVNITAELAEASTAVQEATPKATYNNKEKATQAIPETRNGEMQRLIAPDAVIGYRKTFSRNTENISIPQGRRLCNEN